MSNDPQPITNANKREVHHYILHGRIVADIVRYCCCFLASTDLSSFQQSPRPSATARLQSALRDRHSPPVSEAVMMAFSNLAALRVTAGLRLVLVALAAYLASLLANDLELMMNLDASTKQLTRSVNISLGMGLFMVYNPISSDVFTG